METKTQSPSRLELTLCNLLPYSLIGKSERGSRFILGYSSNMRGTGLESRSIDTFLNEKYKPIVHSLSKLTEPILENGEIPIVELFKIAFPDFEKYDLFKTKGVVIRKHLVGYLEFEFDAERSCFKSTHYNDKIVVIGYFGVPNQLQLFEKLKEWHFNIYDLPIGEFIEKSTLTKQ